MTPAPPIPGTHTVIIDSRLAWAGEPLFHVPAGVTITGVTPLYIRMGTLRCR